MRMCGKPVARAPLALDSFPSTAKSHVAIALLVYIAIHSCIHSQCLPCIPNSTTAGRPPPASYRKYIILQASDGWPYNHNTFGFLCRLNQITDPSRRLYTTNCRPRREKHLDTLPTMTRRMVYSFGLWLTIASMLGRRVSPKGEDTKTFRYRNDHCQYYYATMGQLQLGMFARTGFPKPSLHLSQLHVLMPDRMSSTRIP